MCGDFRIVTISFSVGSGIGPEILAPVLLAEKEVVTIIKSPHKHKDSREQFEMRTHKRLIDVLYPTQKTIESLTKLDLPAGVEIEIKL